MCVSYVEERVERLLAGVLRDMCVALCPEDPDSVVVGPVDFGHQEDDER